MKANYQFLSFCVYSILMEFLLYLMGFLCLKLIGLKVARYLIKCCSLPVYSILMEFLLYLMGFLCCPLPYNLPPGSSAPNLTTSASEFDGTGWTGWTGYQKGPLIFLILRYIKHYTYINLYIYNIYIKKLSRQISCGF